jgi:hypothetical protein
MYILNQHGEATIKAAIERHGTDKVRKAFAASSMARNAWYNDAEAAADNAGPGIMIGIEIGPLFSGSGVPVTIELTAEDFDSRPVED